MPLATQAGKEVHVAAAQVLAALHAVFLLDPVPHQMREYVPIRDDRLRRSADNLSAVLAGLRRDPKMRRRLVSLVKALSESKVTGITEIRSSLGDVMVALQEQIDGERRELPARLMSDGTLRFLAILAALLEAPGSTVGGVPGGSDAVGRTTLVIEELENGLHPSQAAALVALVKGESSQRHIRTLATTHSPALLDALDGEDHEGVVVWARDPQGWSRLSTLTELPNYFDMVTGGTLGRVAAADRLRPGKEAGRSRALEQIFGVR